METAGALGEVWALGVRNPQRFGWDPANGNLYLADMRRATREVFTRCLAEGYQVTELIRADGPLSYYLVERQRGARASQGR